MNIAYTHLKDFSNDFIPEQKYREDYDYIICTECRHILEFLNFSTDGYQYGDYSPNYSDEWSEEGFESSGDATTTCPDCGCLTKWDENRLLSNLEKEVLNARFQEQEEGTFDKRKFKKKKEIKVDTSPEEEEIIKKEKITKIINFKICRHCKKIIPRIEDDGEKYFCPHCMKEYHEEENNRPIF